MTKEITIVELADMVGGRVLGGPSEGKKITGTCALDTYVSGKVSFVRNQKYGELLAHLHNGVVLVPESLADLCEKYPQNIYIVVEDLVNSLMDVQDFFYEEQFIIAQEGISPTAKVDGTVKLGESVYIGENVYVGKGAVIAIGQKYYIIRAYLIT